MKDTPNESTLPKDIGGLQSIVRGTFIQKGDIWVRDGKPHSFVDESYFGYPCESHQGFSVYRKMGVPRHYEQEPVPSVYFEGTGYKMDQELKPTNPKDACGSDKLPLHLWPTTATALGSLALLDGALKYGRSNFRPIGVRSSIYHDAAKRHLDAWFEGEDEDPDSGLDHLGHALACLAILVDSKATGNLNDDRMYRGKYREYVSQLTPHVKRLKEKHKDKSPKHYTMEDSK